ncbi:MAG: MFS transporter, partial [Candidatus Woesebacteria bacterium]
MYIIERFLHNRNIVRHPTDGIKALAQNYLLRQLAMGMVTSFGVLFIFQLASDFFVGLFLVAAFIVAQRIAVAASIPFSASFISRVGYRRTIFVSLVALVVKMYLFSITQPDYLLPLIPAAIFGGFVISSYFLSYHAIFLDDNTEAKIGEQAGRIESLGRVAIIVSPFLAGYIVDVFSFHILFLTVVALLILSMMPLVTMKHHKRHFGSYSLGKAWDFIRKRPKVSWSMYFWVITYAIQSVYWPIYLYLVVKDYRLFGLIGSVVMMASSVAVYYTGKLYDKSSHRRLFWGSTVMVSASWLARFVSTTSISAGISDTVNRLFSPPWWMKVRRKELLAGEETDSLVFGAAHEYLSTAAVISGAVIGYLVLVVGKG